MDDDFDFFEWDIKTTNTLHASIADGTLPEHVVWEYIALARLPTIEEELDEELFLDWIAGMLKRKLDYIERIIAREPGVMEPRSDSLVELEKMRAINTFIGSDIEQE